MVTSGSFGLVLRRGSESLLIALLSVLYLPSLPSLFHNMPPGQRSQSTKLKETTAAIKKLGWRSTNDFIQAFYCSPLAAQALRYQPGSTFGPANVLASWKVYAPSEESRNEINRTITRAAAEIVIQESTRAYRNSSLQISSTGLNIPFLTTEFGLNKIQKTYTSLLPCLYLLLTMLLSAENDYERKIGRGKKGKVEMVPKVSNYFILGISPADTSIGGSGYHQHDFILLESCYKCLSACYGGFPLEFRC